jgi:CHASE1-domain containing sensor protein
MAGVVSTPLMRPLKSPAAPWVVLVLGLGLTAAIWLSAREEMRNQEAARFGRLKENLLAAMNARFQAAEQALFGGRALVESTGELSPVQWSRYVDSVWPFFDRGVTGLGYVQRVPRTGIAALERRIRSSGRPGFTADRTGTAPAAYLVTHLELRTSPAAALGTDLGLHAAWRAAAETAMRTGSVTLSEQGPIADGRSPGQGCHLLLPVYAAGATPAEPAAREAALQGWVYVVLRVDALLREVALATEGQLDLAVFDGETAEPARLLFHAPGESGERRPAAAATLAESFPLSI